MTRYDRNYFTERLFVRPLTENDIPIWEKFFHHPEAIQFIPAQPGKTPQERSEFWIRKQLDRYKDGRYGLMALINKETNELVGQCGLLTQEVDKEPVIEIGYHLFPKFWKQGYATEAALFFKELAFKNNYTNELVSIIDIGNIDSAKVAMRNGMKKIKTTTFWELEVDVYSVKKDPDFTNS